MVENTIFVEKYTMPDERFALREREILRYAGYPGTVQDVDTEVQNLLRQVVDELKDSFTYKVCYRRVPITWNEGMPELPFSQKSKDLAKCLKGSKAIIVFAATIGIGIDRLIAKYQRVSPAKALLMQAYGAERVEVLCDVFCNEKKEQATAEGLQCTPRFSPGYGDLPLDVQKELFQLLDCSRQIGISLGDSLLMTPSKSVPAIFVLGECVTCQREQKCSQCDQTDCEYRED